jgi:hypothetical protein
MSDFDSIVQSIKMDSQKLKGRYSPQTHPESGPNFIDIDGFIEVLYSLLESNDYILKEGDEPSLDKFVFTEEYPDEEVDNRNIVTFEIQKRSPACLSSNEEPFKGTKYYRPLYLGDENDGNAGGRIIHLQSIYDNRLRFKCWSGKTSQARKLASLFESILIKHYYSLRKYVPVLIYEGRGDGRVTNEYGANRYQGIALDFFLRTNERLTLREQEIVCFEESIRLKK